MKQTFIIQVNGEKESPLFPKYFDFWRVGCKRKETALKYLKGWKKQALDNGLDSFYKCFFVTGATYQIIETPDGYNEGETVLSGQMKDL